MSGNSGASVDTKALSGDPDDTRLTSAWLPASTATHHTAAGTRLCSAERKQPLLVTLAHPDAFQTKSFETSFEREIFHLLVHFPNAHNSQKSIWELGPKQPSHHLLSPKVHVSRRLELEEELALESGHSLMGCGVPHGISTSVPNVCPQVEHFKQPIQACGNVISSVKIIDVIVFNYLIIHFYCKYEYRLSANTILKVSN